MIKQRALMLAGVAILVTGSSNLALAQSQGYGYQQPPCSPPGLSAARVCPARLWNAPSSPPGTAYQRAYGTPAAPAYGTPAAPGCGTPGQAGAAASQAAGKAIGGPAGTAVGGPIGSMTGAPQPGYAPPAQPGYGGYQAPPMYGDYPPR